MTHSITDERLAEIVAINDERKRCRATAGHIDVADIDAIIARLRATEKALKPFADSFCGWVGDADAYDLGDEDAIKIAPTDKISDFTVTLGDFRKAHKTMEGE